MNQSQYPEFVDNAAYISMDSAVPEADQLRAMLTNLTRVHLLTAHHFDSFDALIREYLIAGTEVFHLETGIVSRIDDDSYHVCDVISPLEVLEKGMEFPLEDTYCREVYRSKKVIGFPEVGKLDYMNCHPVYQNLKLESYLSAPIFVEDKLFGTLNFTSTKPRFHGFSHHEHDLIKLMANSIGAYILLRQKEDSLLELNDKIKRFVGYVSHDLRNPLGSILGFCKLAAKPNISPSRLDVIVTRIGVQAEAALELVSAILDSAALSTGKLTLNKQAVAAKVLVESAIESVLPFAEDLAVVLKLDCHFDGEVVCDSDRIRQSLCNLLINAIKYSPNDTEVTITVSQNGDGCLIKITNSVDHNPTVLSAKNREVYSSVGFGLDIVNAVMEAHHCEITQAEKDGFYTAQFTLPLHGVV